MKPVAVFRHSPGEGPGYFAQFLEDNQIPWVLLPIDDGHPVPERVDSFSGLCFMGGPMSVNDPLPWIEPVCSLIRQAVERNLPVIGHCLGGQLMSKALGGKITRNPVKEIGWCMGKLENSDAAQIWLGDFANSAHILFQWHGETFTLPTGSTHLASSADCNNQIFALGPHLGLQCHVEMTPEMIAAWCEQWEDECTGQEGIPSIQAPQQMIAETHQYLPALRDLARQLYGQWIKGLART